MLSRSMSNESEAAQSVEGSVVVVVVERVVVEGLSGRGLAATAALDNFEGEGVGHNIKSVEDRRRLERVEWSVVDVVRWVCLVSLQDSLWVEEVCTKKRKKGTRVAKDQSPAVK